MSTHVYVHVIMISKPGTQNDRLLAVGSTRISSCKQAAKLMKSAGEKFNIRLERPQLKISPDLKFYEDTVSFKVRYRGVTMMFLVHVSPMWWDSSVVGLFFQ